MFLAEGTLVAKGGEGQGWRTRWSREGQRGEAERHPVQALGAGVWGRAWGPFGAVEVEFPSRPDP